MADLGKVVYLSEAQKETLFTNGSITTNGQTIEYSDDDLYVTPSAIDIVPAQGSSNLITSGGVYNAIAEKLDANSKGVAGGVAELDANGKVPIAQCPIGGDVAQATADWLDEHITQETGYVIDDSLTVAGAAADAKKTGDELNDLKTTLSLLDTDVGEKSGNITYGHLTLAQGDRTSKLNGSASTSFYCAIESNPVRVANMSACPRLFTAKANKKYTLIVKPISGSHNGTAPLDVQVFLTDGTNIIAQIPSSGGSAEYIPNVDTPISVCIYVKYEVATTNLIFEEQLIESESYVTTDSFNRDSYNQMLASLYKETVNLTWVSGTISADGSDGVWAARIRSSYMPCEYLSYITIAIDDGFKWIACFYDDNYVYMPDLSLNNWISTGSTFVVPHNASYVRFALANANDTTIPTDDSKHITVVSDSKIWTDLSENYNEPIPTYYTEQISNVISKHISDMLSIGKNGDDFIFITDIHWSGNYKHSPALIKKIVEDTNIHTVISGGDLIDRSLTSKESQITTMRDCINLFKNIGAPFLTAIGNHERNSAGVSDSSLYLSENEVFSITQNAANWMPLSYADLERICFYYDKTATKTRYLFIDSGQNNIGDYDITASEITWMADAIGLTPSDWHIIVIVHDLGGYQSTTQPVGESNIFVYKTGAQAMLDRLDALLPTHKIEAVFAGHTHYDDNAVTAAGIPIIWTNSDAIWQYYGMTQPSKHTIEAQCFDVVAMDYTAKKIYMRRVGRGSDRTISY